MIGWSDSNIKKAVIWLSFKKNKSILELTDEDYNENGILFEKYINAHETNIKVFNISKQTGWPCKPFSDDSNRPERAHPKKILIFFILTTMSFRWDEIKKIGDQGHRYNDIKPLETC